MGQIQIILQMAERIISLLQCGRIVILPAPQQFLYLCQEFRLIILLPHLIQYSICGRLPVIRLHNFNICPGHSISHILLQSQPDLLQRLLRRIEAVFSLDVGVFHLKIVQRKIQHQQSHDGNKGYRYHHRDQRKTAVLFFKKLLFILPHQFSFAPSRTTSRSLSGKFRAAAPAR